jgi:hypothetical protein
MDPADPRVLADPRTNLLGLAVATMPTADALRDRFANRFLIELPDAPTAMQSLAEALNRRRREEELEAEVRRTLEETVRARLNDEIRPLLEREIRDALNREGPDQLEAMVEIQLEAAIAERMEAEIAERLADEVVARLEQEFGEMEGVSPQRPRARMLSMIVADVMVSAVHRDPSLVGVDGQRPAHLDELTNLARALLAVARPDEDIHGTDLSNLVQALRAAASAPSARSAWPRFVANGGSDAMDLTQAENSLPYCSASSGTSATGQPANEIMTSFESNLAVSSFAKYVDPRNWPICSMYFREVQPADAFAALPQDKWVAPFREVVDLLPIWTLVTPLEFSYARNDDTEISVYYRLVVPTDWITVDEGYVRARTNPHKPPGTTSTLVETKKVIRFVDPWLQSLTCLPCFTFWGELAKDMALRCCD